MIKADSVSFRYNSSGPMVIRDMSFSFAHPSLVLLKGPSGTGKTTLIHLLAGLMAPTAGQLIVLNRLLHEGSDYRRSLWRAQNIGVIFQKLNLHPELSVKENIRLLYDLYPRLMPKWDEDLYVHYMHHLNLKIDDARPAGKLSLGQQQRVAIVRVLMQRPKLILADEPTSSLDHNNSQLVVNTLLEYVKRTQASLFLSSHEEWIHSLFEHVIEFKEHV